MKLVPVPEDGLAPVAVHAKLYAAVPPEAEVVQATAVPTVPVVGQLTAATRAGGLIATEAEFDAAPEAESVTVTLIVYEPFVL